MDSWPGLSIRTGLLSWMDNTSIGDYGKCPYIMIQCKAAKDKGTACLRESAVKAADLITRAQRIRCAASAGRPLRV